MSSLVKDPGDSQVMVPGPGETFTAEDGTVSVVLADTLDANYEPSQEEIEAFADWMGMKLPEDNEFLYIAREGLKAPLPADWRPCRTNDEEIYYFNFRTGESTWNHPMDEFFREKFLNEKQRKEKGAGALHGAKKGTPLASTSAVSTWGEERGGSGRDVGGGNGGKNSGSHRSSIVEKSLGQVAGDTPQTAVNALTPPLGTARSTMGGVIVSPNERVPVNALKPMPAKRALPQSSGERRIVSEAEKNLEEKIRQEREAAFRLEEEKAEAAHEATMQDMRRAHDRDIQKLQDELADAQERFEKKERESVLKKQQELKRRKVTLDGVLQEEQDLQQQLSKLREQHAQRVASEVEKAETAAKERHEREQRQRESETAALLEKLREETHAEFLANKAELQKKSQEEERRLKEEKQERHQAELTALQHRNAKQLDKDEGSGAAKSMADEVAAIRAKEKEEVAAIMQKSKKEQAALRTTMEATLDQLRKELCELENSATASHDTSNDPSLDDALAEVGRRWQVEEQRRMQALAEERHQKIAAVKSRLSFPASSPTSFCSNAAAAVTLEKGCEGLSTANEETLAEKEIALRETEALLRATLKEELTRTTAPTEVQIAEAINGDVNVFVRSIEVQRRFEREEFERTRDRALAEQKNAMEASTQKMAEQKLNLETGSVAEMEQGMQRAVAGEVEKALRAMAQEAEAARKRLQQHYHDERCALFAAVDEEMLVHERRERGAIDAQEEAKAKQKAEEMMRLLAAKKTTTEMEPAKRENLEDELNGGMKLQSSSCTSGVPLEWLQRRLDFMEQTCMEQEQRLQAELRSVKAETERLRETLAVQEHSSLPQEFPPGTESSFLVRRAQFQNDAGLTPGGISTTSVALGKQERCYASPSTLEALRFLSEQQRELSVRRGALNAAREEWQNDVRNASSCIQSTPRPARPLPGPAGGDDVGSRLLTLVGSLDDRLQELTGCFEKLQTTAVNSSPRWQEKQRRSRSGGRCHRRSEGVADRNNISSKAKKRSLRDEQLAGISGDQKSCVACMQKWSQLLLEFTPLPPLGDEISESIQKYVTGR